MKKKINRLELNKKQVSDLNTFVIGGAPSRWTNNCPIETVQITMCYGANQCQKWPDTY